MHVHQAIALVADAVTGVPGFELPSQQAELLVSAALQVSVSELKSLGEQPCSPAQCEFISRYLGSIPLIPVPLFLGYTEVNGIKLSVSASTLLPGTETSSLLGVASKLIRSSRATTIVELGTGCGVVPAVLALLHPTCRFIVTEISEAAATVARANVHQYQLEKQISVLSGSWYDPLGEMDLRSKVDLIISNPPYCSSYAIKSLPRGFLDYAPRGAIDGGEDGLRAHKAVIDGSRAFLSAGGHLVLQTDTGQADRVSRYVEEIGGFGKADSATGSGGEGRFVVARRIGRRVLLDEDAASVDVSGLQSLCLGLRST